VVDISHLTVDTGVLRMHVAASGPDDGPTVLLCHGFPECWYSWRHQLAALGNAGYHVLAPDQRGYGRTDAPPAVDAYTQLHLMGDLVGLLDALGIATATVVGHDWGAPVAWNAALLRPDRFPAVAGLSVPCGQPGAPGGTAGLRRALGDAFLYVLYFQDEGVAEAELDADVRGTLRRTLYSLSGDIPLDARRFFDPRARCFNDLVTEPDALPEWLTEDDLDIFTQEFERVGTFRHGLNWYRCIDRNAQLMAPFAGAKLAQPALFVGADRDVIFGQTRESVLATRQWVPGLRDPVWIEDCGHWIQQEEPVQLNDALLAFLSTLA
jgi:pimeloyl-ACP methyl ester carboxylesterase